MADPAAEVNEELNCETSQASNQLGALLPRISSLISVALIVLFAGALMLAVAGILHPVWEATQTIAKPWFDQLMIWLNQLLEYLPR